MYMNQLRTRLDSPLDVLLSPLHAVPIQYIILCLALGYQLLSDLSTVDTHLIASVTTASTCPVLILSDRPAVMSCAIILQCFSVFSAQSVYHHRELPHTPSLSMVSQISWTATRISSVLFLVCQPMPSSLLSVHSCLVSSRLSTILPCEGSCCSEHLSHYLHYSCG